MREHHRVQQSEATGEPDGDLERACLKQADGEEEDAERRRRGAPFLREPVRQEGLSDEAAAERVKGEQPTEACDDSTRFL
jgi:hypothetical protein